MEICQSLVRHPAVFIINEEYGEPNATHVLVSSSPSLSALKSKRDDVATFKANPITYVREPFEEELENEGFDPKTESITIDLSTADIETLLKKKKVFLASHRYQVEARFERAATEMVSFTWGEYIFSVTRCHENVVVVAGSVHSRR